LSYLRLTAYDADIFMDCLPALLAQVEQSVPVWYADVYEVMAQVWQGYFPLDEAQGLVDGIGRLLDLMDYDAEDFWQ
jgi:hypothetical protein